MNQDVLYDYKADLHGIGNRDTMVAIMCDTEDIYAYRGP